MHIAVLLSGQRRTFDAVRNSWEANLVCPLTRKDFTVVTFACWDDRAWRWPTSRTFDVLIQFERNHACWERAKTFESQHSVRFNVVIKAARRTFNVPMADVLNAASAASIKRSLLSKARCWMPVRNCQSRAGRGVTCAAGHSLSATTHSLLYHLMSSPMMYLPI